MPTISITNSIAFANLKDPRRDFGPDPALGHDRLDRRRWPFIFILVVEGAGVRLSDAALPAACSSSAGSRSLVLAVQPDLPHTPPTADRAGRDAPLRR